MDQTNEHTPPGKKLSRRNLLKLAGPGAVALALLKYDRILNGLLGDEYEKHTQEAEKFIKDIYGLDVLTDPPEFHAVISGTKLNKYELSRGLGLVIEELAKYPPDIFKKNGVKNLRLLNNIKIHGSDKRMAGYADLSGGICIGYSSEYFEAYRGFYRQAFHHEVYHALDYQDGGYEQDDQNWREIHQCGCQPYEVTSDGSQVISGLESFTDWFANDYGQSNPREDRATFASFLMIPVYNKDIVARADTEPDPKTRQILTTKINLIKENYKKWSGDKMNDSYWNDLVQYKVKWGS